MRFSSLFGPAAAGWPSLLAVLPTLNALTFESVSIPQLDLTSLGRVSITGDFDGVSLYQYKGQTESIPHNGTQALLTPLPNGILTNLSSSDAQIMAMCPFTQKDGTFAGIFVGGNFTSLGGVDSPGAALFDPSTNKVTALPGLSGSVAAVTCDQDNNRVYVGGKFTYDNATNAVAWTPRNGWTDLPFNGLNGPVSSILRADNGHIIFGGSFDSLGNSTSSKMERQVLNLQNATVTSDADSPMDGYSDPRNIICSTSGEAAKGKTYLLHDYAPGFWRADLGFDFFPTKIRLYNTHMDGRGTKDFLLRALPDNGIMNLTYTDESGNKANCDSSCPLSSNPSEKYREFTMVNPVGMRGLQIEILDWYGQGAGLNGIEVFQDQILTYAIDQYNEPTCAGIEYPAQSTRTGSWTLDSGYMSAKVTDSDASSTTVTFEPDVKKSGNYSIKVYAPGCTQDNSCSSRGIVNVTGTFSSGSEFGPLYLHQTNNDDKYDEIQSVYVDASSDSFRPKLTLRAKDGQGDITIVASRVRFELLSSTGGLNGLYDHDPAASSKIDTTDLTKSDIDKAGTSLNHNATISIIKEHDDVIYVAGNFSDQRIRNIVSIRDGDLTPMPGSGLNSPVLAMATLDDVLYVGGRFTDTSDGGTDGLEHVAAYSFSSKQWSALGAGLNGPVNSIWPVELNASTAINETIIAVSGDFDQIIAFNGNPAVSVAGFAIWVPSHKDWLQNLNVTQMQFGGQLSTVTSHNNTLILAGNLASDGIIAGGAVSLLESDDLQLIPLSMKINHQKSSTGLITGAYDTDSNRNLTIYGGHFTVAGSNGSTVENIAIHNGTDQTISGLPRGVDSNSTFVSMLVHNDTLYAGGNVTGNLGRSTLGGLVIFDLKKNEFSETQSKFSGSDVAVNAIANRPGSSDVYFGGNFEGVGQFPCDSVCCVNPTTGTWTRPGTSFSGNVIELQWINQHKLMAVGDLQVRGNKTSIATYDVKADAWSAFPGASVSEIPGNVTAFTPASADMSKFWIGGVATNGSAFFLSYDGSNFLSPANHFSEGTIIHGLEVLPVRQDHSEVPLLKDAQTLLILGSLEIPGFGHASAALYDGTDVTPFILSQRADGTPGSMSKFFSENKNPYTKECEYPTVFLFFVTVTKTDF